MSLHAPMLLLLISIALLLRGPYFFDSVLDWDESTFIIIGQGLLDGSLPWVDYWDLKPFFAFLPFSIFIAAFGESIAAVRLGGALVVALAAYFLYLTGVRIRSRQLGFLAALLLIVFTSTIQDAGGGFDGQAVMTEHILILPLSIFLWLSTSPYRSPSTLFMSGVFLSLAALTRTNLVFLCFGVAVEYAIRSFSREREEPRHAFYWFALGVSAPAFAIGLVYAVAGKLSAFLKANIHAPIVYSFTDQDKLAFFESAEKIWERILTQIEVGSGLLWVSLPLSLIYIVARRMQSSSADRRETSFGILTLVYMGITIFSIILTGHGFPHYLIQVIPFAALLCAMFFDRLLFSRIRLIAAVIVAAGLTAAVWPIAEKAQATTSKVLRSVPLYSDTGFKVAQYLVDNGGAGEYVFATKYHIVTWLAAAKVPTKYVHPSLLGREAILKIVDGEEGGTTKELARIFQKEPAYIVSDDKVGFLRGAARDYFFESLEMQYILVKRIDTLGIYRRDI